MIDKDVRNLATGKNFAAFTTLNAKGEPRTHVMWVGADDEHMLINTETHRAKYHDISGDPRVVVTVWNAENPYQYAEVRGRVVGEVRGDEARTHIDELSRRYTGDDYDPSAITSERVILQVAPDRVHKHNM